MACGFPTEGTYIGVKLSSDLKFVCSEESRDREVAKSARTQRTREHGPSVVQGLYEAYGLYGLLHAARRSQIFA